MSNQQWKPVDAGDSGSPYRLCELVEVADEPDEPISEAALQAAGWTYDRYRWLSPGYTKAPRVVSVQFPVAGTGISIKGVDRLGPVIDFPGCQSMAQLAALISMLGGAE